MFVRAPAIPVDLANRPIVDLRLNGRMTCWNVG
jgi:hypothetical protein